MSDVSAALASLETTVLQALRGSYDTSWAAQGTHVHDDPFSRLYWLRSGEGRVHHHGREFKLVPGTLFAIPAHTPSRYWCPRRMDLCWLHFRASVFGSLCPFACFGWNFAATPSDRGRISALWDRLLTLAGRDDGMARLETDGLLRQLLAPFAVTVTSGDDARLIEVRRLRPVIDWIDQHLSEPVRLADIARVLHLQPTYFSNLFARSMGMPPLRYLARRRIAVAQAELSKGGLAVKQIAARLGFADEFHFSRTFKRVVGISPSAYRALGRNAP